MELEEAELRRLESGTKARNTKARARGGGAKVRFYLSKEKMKRIFAEHPELRSHYLKEVHSLGLPRTVFWARYCHAAAHMKPSLRCEAVQTASRGSNGQKGRKSGRNRSGQQIIENRVSRRMPALYQWKVGTEVAWVPQGLLETLRVHPELKDVDDGPDGGQLNKPADGTANAAIVTCVRRRKDGVTLLTLRPTDALGTINNTWKESGGGGGADGDDDDGDVAEGSESGAARATFTLPVLDRRRCDVDQYCLELNEYKAALNRVCTGVHRSVHVTVPFAEKADVSTLRQPKEVLWEGRIFNDAVVYDQAYPTSKYRCLHIVWYRKLKENGPEDPPNDRWIIDDDEQTDNLQSPWCTEHSQFHATWCSINTGLSQPNRMLRPTVEPPHALHEVQTSLQLGMNNDENIMNILNERLMRNEATVLFHNPLPDHEELYPTEALYPGIVVTPMCLLDIVGKAQIGGYADDFSKFAQDIETMIAHVMTFNELTSAEYIAGRMLLADWQAVIDAMEEGGER